MTILFLDQYGALGGAQRCLIDLLPAVVSRWKAVVAAPDDGPLLDRARQAGADAVPLRIGPFRSGRKSPADMIRFAWQFPPLVRAIQKIVDEREVRLLYVNGPRLLPAATYTREPLPVVFHCHSLFPGAVSLVGRRLRAARATVIANCRYVAAPLAPWVPSERVRIVYNGVDDISLARAGGRIGVLGRIAPEKGQHIFAEAARLLRGYRFVIRGEAAFGGRDYERRVREAAAEAGVDVEPWSDDVRAFYSSLDALVVPSLDEATTRVIPEAFSAGVPVVAFATGGIPEIVEERATGLLVATPTAEALAARIEELMASADLRARLAANARAAYESRFTLSRWRREIVGILERLQQEAEQQARAHRGRARDR
jgi:glycosyltransferase involved in cell wall biosynthesis